LSATPIGAGAAFPDISLPTLDGRDLRFVDLRGKRLVLYLWGSW